MGPVSFIVTVGSGFTLATVGMVSALNNYDYYDYLANGIVNSNGIIGADAKNGMSHAIISAYLANDTSNLLATAIGYAHEALTLGIIKDTNDSFQDLWNNQVGRDIAQYIKDNNLVFEDVIDDLIMDAKVHGQIVLSDYDPRLGFGQNPKYFGPSEEWEGTAADRDFPTPYPPNTLSVLFKSIEGLMLVDVDGVKNLIDTITDLTAALARVSFPFSPLLQTHDGTGKLFDLAEWITQKVAEFTASELAATPLIFDIDGDGVEVTALNSNGAVYWDIDNDGFREASSWVGADDALLARDLNSNGVIDNHSELFGTATTDGFSILTALDSNTDNKITSADTAWSTLLAWRDINGDGVSQAAELHSLTSLGITEISLADSVLTGVTNNGNVVSHRSTFVIGGNTHNIDDVRFNYDNVNSIDVRDYDFDPETLLLPELRGYGTVSHLSIAMSNDATLKGFVQEVAEADAMTLLSPHFNIEQRVTDIMYRWAGVDGVDPDSRWLYVDARSLTFMEKLLDNPFNQVGSGNSPNPGHNAGDMLNESFATIHKEILERILAQTSLRSLFSNAPVYNYAADTFTGSYTLNANAIGELLDGAALDDQFYLWAYILKRLDYTTGLENLTTPEIVAIDALIDLYDTGSTLSYTFMATNFEYVFGTALNGTASADTITFGIPSGAAIYGLGGNDTITGNAGDDVIAGGAGTDTMSGGEGDDKFTFIASDVSSDVVNGGNGHDTVSLTYSAGGPINISGISLTSIEGLELTTTNGGTVTVSAAQVAGLDSIIHTSGAAGVITLAASAAGTYNFSGVTTLTGLLTINGTSGTDTITGTAFDETITGGTNGSDVISGGAGNDTLYSSAHASAANTLYGGDGNDTLYAGYGTDTIYGDDGDDLFVQSGTYMWSNDTLSGGAGHDIFRAFHNGTLGWTANLSGLEELQIGGTSSTVNINTYSLGSFSSFTVQTPGTTVGYLLASSAGTYDFTGKTISSDITFGGSSGADTIIGSSGNDRIRANAGDDIISTGDGDDTILFSGGGYDTIDGGNGTDTLLALANNTDILLTSLSNVEAISSDGFTGIDIIGSTAANTLDFSGVTLSGIVGIYGGNGNDTITGNSVNNTIYGDAGNDTITGGGGNDTLTGGANNDTFVFASTGNGVDTITDFANGVDKIDLRAMGLTFAGLTVTTVGTAVNITKTGSTDIDITLNSFTAANVDASDFIFV